MSILLILCSFVLFDTEFVKTLLDFDESAWQRLGDESIPPEQDLEVFADLADKIARSVPRHLYRKNVTGTFPSQRGEMVRLEGKIVSVTKYGGVYRCAMDICKMDINDLAGTPAQPAPVQTEVPAKLSVMLFSSSIPQAWEQDAPIDEPAAAFGIYVKSYKGTPIFVVPAIEWYPGTWLGNLGFNVASFDQVPVGRVTELEQHDEETNRRMFKFTEADVEPFYGLLWAVSETPTGWLEAEAKKLQAEESISVTDLFNRPDETRGKPVLLRGTAKRIVPTPVTDSAVQSLFGIDHYYQVFLFAEGSQGNPIVVCVRSLPEGMPTGDAEDFSVSITVAAVPYKLWIYTAQEKPHYAPLLAGRSLTWHMDASDERRRPAGFASVSFTVFFLLTVLWIACRFWARRLFASQVSDYRGQQ